MDELLGQHPKVSPQVAVNILRNKEGLNDKTIGFGNEKALNQLLAHHGIVFKPEELLVWVSSNPYQLGEFVTYNLNEVFNTDQKSAFNATLAKTEQNLAKDPFQFTKAYLDYEEYRKLRTKLLTAITHKEHLNPEIINTIQQKNPEHWEVYHLAGRYYYEKGFYTAALNAFEKADAKEFSTLVDEERNKKYIRKLNRKLNL